MRLARFLRGCLVTALALVIAVAVGKGWRQRETDRWVDALHQQATTGRDGEFTNADLDGLPEPVRAYFATVLEEGQPYVGSVRLEQEGELRLTDASSPWRSFTATQHITVDPPGFFWDAAVSLGPLLSLHIRDLFQDGDGTAAVSLFGVVPLDGAEPSPELNEAELVRYLAEAVWYPTALLPREGVEWEPVDENSARATIEHDGVSASLTFTFNDADEVTRVHADERYRRVDGGYEPTPWTGYWHDYETRHGMRVPTAGEVVWHLPEGDMTAWRGRIVASSYDER